MTKASSALKSSLEIHLQENLKWVNSGAEINVFAQELIDYEFWASFACAAVSACLFIVGCFIAYKYVAVWKKFYKYNKEEFGWDAGKLTDVQSVVLIIAAVSSLSLMLLGALGVGFQGLNTIKAKVSPRAVVIERLIALSSD